MNKLTVASCELCDSAGGEILWRDELCRVVLVEDCDYPGFCRVILNRHVSEMTDLDAATRHTLMRVVFAVEQALRELMQPEKINLASLGNRVAHLHWHVIARFSRRQTLSRFCLERGKTARRAAPGPARRPEARLAQIVASGGKMSGMPAQ